MKPDSTERSVRVGLISLGCAKNLVDAEIMVGTLLKDGIEITNDASQADVVIINTCSFIDSAQEESVDTILESAELRAATNRGQGLIVSGCLTQRFRAELPTLLPEVDAFIASTNSPKSPASSNRRWPGARKSSAARECSSRRLRNMQPATRPVARALDRGHAPTSIYPGLRDARFRLTPAHFAYVKIAEGCNHPAASASSRGCAVPIAAASRPTSWRKPGR